MPLKPRPHQLRMEEEFRVALILEKPRSAISEIGIDQLFKDDSQAVFVCSDPYPEIIRVLSKQLDMAEVIAEGLANNLYKLVADTSAGKTMELWNRGGFPESFLAPDDHDSARWREDFIWTYLERDVPQFGHPVFRRRHCGDSGPC